MYNGQAVHRRCCACCKPEVHKEEGMRLRLTVFTLLVLPALLWGCAFIGSTKVYTNPDYPPGDIKYLNVSMPALPVLPAADWINASPGIIDSLRGKVVLVDFWDYTCVNCIRTLPYLKEWYKRYAKDGFVIMGIHSPEFAFAQKRANLESAVEKFGLKYPVVMDNNFALWKEFGNQSWPEEYLFDQDGILRYVHSGEGEYGNSEEMIQRLLKEKDPHLKFPALMQSLRPTDVPGAVCYLPTSETYLGYDAGRIGNSQGYTDNRAVDYRQPKSVKKDRFYLEGKWVVRGQYVRYAGERGDGKILLNYSAASVNLVLRSDHKALLPGQNGSPIRVFVYLDGLPVPKKDWPSGMKLSKGGKTFFNLGDPGMYDLVECKKYGRHILTLILSSDAFAAYSFTFGTTCVNPGS